MPEDIPRVKISGLHTYNSELSAVPEGSLSRADNISINRVNVAEPRRGYNFLTYDLSGASTRAKEFIFYLARTFVHTGTTLYIYDDSSGYISRGTFSPPSGRSVKHAAVSKNMYITSSTGILKLDDVTNSAEAVGVPQGLYIETADTGASGILDNNHSVAYRYVIGTRDANSNLIIGAVSGRTVHVSGATSRNVSVTCYIPSGLTTSHFLQVYRTRINTVHNTPPGVELQLCYEATLSSTNISNGYMTFTDLVPDDLLGEALYTNPSQQGITETNNRPPVAKDIAEYKQHLFFGYTTSKHRLFLTLISSGGTGLVVNDTVTIAGQVYTAKAVFDQTNKEFVVDTASSSASVRIDNTIRSLIKCINGNSSSTVYAYLISDYGDLPGKILLEEISIGGSAFTALSSRGSAWAPNLESVTATTSSTSTNDTYKNGLMWSKKNLPEACPTKNIVFVGSSDAEIIRIAALRDGLFILKEDGVFVLRGEDQTSFQVTLLDNTAKLVAENAVAVGNNQIFAFCGNGIVIISDTGVSIVSLPIKDQILDLLGTIQTEVETYAYAAAYETEGKFLLALPSFDGDTYAKQIFTYDFYSDWWTKWSLDVVSMAVNPETGELYLGCGETNRVKTERKSYDFSDYADYGSEVTISAASGTTLTISGVDGMAVGDLISQGDTDAYIESINSLAGTIEVDIDVSWTLSTATHLKGIPIEIEWNDEICGDPAVLKQFVEAQFHFKRSYIKDMTFTFSTDANSSENDIVIRGSNGSGNWGDFDWGDAVWGGDPSRLPVRVSIPRNASRGTRLKTALSSRVAYSDFQLEGWAPIFNVTGTRVAR